MSKTTLLFAGALCAGTLCAEIVVPDSPVNLVRDGRAYAVESAYNAQSGDQGGNAFNGSLSDRWLGIKPVPSTGRVPTATIHFARRFAVNAYRIYGHANQQTSRSPKAWTFYGSKDGETWIVLDSRSDVTGWSTGQGRLFTFENAAEYPHYRFEITANNGDGSYTTIAEIQLFHFKQTDMLAVASSTEEVGAPTPPYGGTAGHEENDVVTLGMEAAEVVNPADGDRYTLGGFSVLDYGGNSLHEGAVADLPYALSFPGDDTKVVWNWTSALATARANHRDDLTVPYNASLNAITDGGNYDNSATEPRRLFNNATSYSCTSSRWIAKNGTMRWFQYQFLDGPRIVTGCRLVPCPSHSARAPTAFRILGSNDGESWEEVFSVSGLGVLIPKLSVSDTFDFENDRPFSYYRFELTAGGSDYYELVQVELFSIRAPDSLRVVGVPVSCGGTAPGYGYYDGLADGDTLSFTAPATAPADATTRYRCVGHTLSLNVAAPVTNASTTATYVHTDGDAAVLQWLWTPEYLQDISVSGEGGVSSQSFWAAAGETATVTAAATSPSCPFARWTGDVPEGQEQNATITYVVDGPRALVAVFASPIHLKTDGDDSADGSSWANAVATPARALALVPDGGTILVRAGTYPVDGGSLVLDKQVALRSESGPAATVFEAVSGTDGPLLVCSNRNVLVEGVTLKGGSASDGLAGGLRIYGGTATNCVVASCASTAASSQGGGVYMDEDVDGLYDCVVTNCTSAGSGGGVYLLAGAVVGCVLANNTAAGGGGGIYISGTATPVFRDCAVLRNRARGGDGGGASVQRATAVTGCSIIGNTTSGNYGSGIYLGPGCSIADCVVSGNSGASRGGGIYTSAAAISRCVVSGNTCTYFAGGIFTDSSRIDNCLILCNTNTSTSSTTGGGGTFCRKDAVVVNCTYSGNAAHRAQSAWVDGVFAIRNCVFQDGVPLSAGIALSHIGIGDRIASQATQTYASCVFGGDFPAVAGTGTITSDPKLDAGFAPRASSPCVNSGRNAYVRAGETDLLGQPRIHVFGGKARHDVVDMGCFETDFRREQGVRIFLQ